jgi:DNA-binding CsgD family transcriptional regulator/tetratricopeptide (TPR) repeat protein
MDATRGATLIGRGADLDALRESFAESLTYQTRTAIVGGEAGIGKTRLIDEFVAGLPEEAVVLRGQSIDLGRDAPPYAPIVASLRALASELGEQAVAEAAGPALHTLGLLVPDVGGGDVDSDPARQGGEFQLYDAVASTLENASQVRPLVVVIEDVHWADPATLTLLRFLIRMIEHSRILFVISFRSDEVSSGGALRRWLPELERDSRTIRLELNRLSPKQSRELADALLGSEPGDPEPSVVYERADGVPFFIEEFLGCERVRTVAPAGAAAGGFGTASGADGIPDTLTEVLLARYHLLGDSAQRLLRLLAAGGARVEHSLLTLVCDEPEDAIESAAREAVSSGALLVDATAYSFRHALVRDAIHAQLLPSERVRYHTRYAQALQSRGGASADAIEISYHWLAAHDQRNAFSASITAMSQARNAFAFVAAARMGERALELWDQIPEATELAGRSRAELLAETSYILRNAGESERALMLIDEAIAGSPPGEPALYARMLRDKASFLANVGREGSIELLRSALSVLEQEPRSVLRANILGELAARLMLEARFDQAVATADSAYAEAQAVDSQPRMSVALNIRGTARIAQGQIDQGFEDLERAGRLATGDGSAQLRYWVNYSDAMSLLGRFDDAVRIAEEGADEARRRGVERTTGAMLMSNVIGSLFALGQAARAEQLLDRALALDPPIGYSAFLQQLKLQSTLWSGDSAGAERLLRQWRPALVLQLQIDAQSRYSMGAVAAEIALATGSIREAWTQLRFVIEPDHRSYPAYDLPLLAIAARTIASARRTGVLLEPGNNETAAITSRQLEEQLRHAVSGVSFWPTASLYSTIVDAELGGTGGTGTDAHLWAHAAITLGSSRAPAQLAPYAAFRAAESFANAGDRPNARLWADSARREAESIGLGSITHQVTELQHRVGAVKSDRSDRPDSVPDACDASSLDSRLTERERQVLDLVGRGMSNRQIADELFISAKTASVHVSNILRKTGATSRTEAAYVAGNLARHEEPDDV